MIFNKIILAQALFPLCYTRISRTDTYYILLLLVVWYIDLFLHIYIYIYNNLRWRLYGVKNEYTFVRLSNRKKYLLGPETLQ